MSERQATSLSINVYERVGSGYMADNTVISMNISTHLLDGNILSGTSQHLTLAEAKSLLIEMNYVIAEVEAKIMGDATLSKEVVL
jgi:hypothetical protein